MHYCCEVWVNKDTFNSSMFSDPLKNAEELLNSVLYPYQNQSKSNKTFYDYYIIGGRWTGNHDGYESGDDFRNYKKCTYCTNGTRDDLYQSFSRGCNVCSGTGMERLYHNYPHPEDVMELSKVLQNITCYTLVIIDPKKKHPKIYHERTYNAALHTFDPSEFDGKVIPFLKKKGITDGYLITIDYHS